MIIVHLPQAKHDQVDESYVIASKASLSMSRL